jgi:hypothetical protein
MLQYGFAIEQKELFWNGRIHPVPGATCYNYGILQHYWLLVTGYWIARRSYETHEVAKAGYWLQVTG